MSDALIFLLALIGAACFIVYTFTKRDDDRDSWSTIYADDSIKMLRETFCVAQGLVNRSTDPRAYVHSERLQRLIDECDRQRPLAPNGKHGNLHTPTCGCER